MKTIVGEYFEPEIKWPKFESEYAEATYCIGYGILKWQPIETIYKDIIRNSKIVSPSVSDFLSSELNNSQTLTLMKIVSDQLTESDTQLSKSIAQFIRHASICCNNRNFLAHASLEQRNGELILSKISCSGNLISVIANADGLKEIGSSCTKTALFGKLIHSSLVLGANRRAEVVNADFNIEIKLPSEPPQPRAFDVILSAAKAHNGEDLPQS